MISSIYFQSIIYIQTMLIIFSMFSLDLFDFIFILGVVGDVEKVLSEGSLRDARIYYYE